LNGDGGDEAFGGYWRYWLDPWANRYAQLPSLITRGLVPAIADLFPDKSNRPIGGSLVNGLKRLEQLTAIDQRASILRWGSYFYGDLKAELWKAAYRAQLDLSAPESYLVDAFERAPAANFMERTLSTDVNTYLPGDLLVKADRMTMAASLEGRSPFLDHELASWTARLPGKYKIHGRTGKYLLRKAFADYLPAEITGRGKQGFGIPVGAWFRGPLEDWARELLSSPGNLVSEWFEAATVERVLAEHQTGRIDHGKRLYALAVLALWGNKQ